jgi:hypothetical protein
MVDSLVKELRPSMRRDEPDGVYGHDWRFDLWPAARPASPQVSALP